MCQIIWFLVMFCEGISVNIDILLDVLSNKYLDHFYMYVFFALYYWESDIFDYKFRTMGYCCISSIHFVTLYYYISRVNPGQWFLEGGVGLLKLKDPVWNSRKVFFFYLNTRTFWNNIQMYMYWKWPLT